MNRKLFAIVTAVVGIALIAGTVVGFNAAFQSTAPTEADINRCVNPMYYTSDPQCMQRVTAASQQARNIQNMFYLVVAVEIIAIIGALIIIARQKPTQKA